MDKPKEPPPTTFILLQRKDPEPPAEPRRRPVAGEPGNVKPPPEPLPRDVAASLHLGHFRSDPETMKHRIGAARELRWKAWIVLIVLSVLGAAVGDSCLSAGRRA
jgi:hypothetical protein